MNIEEAERLLNKRILIERPGTVIGGIDECMITEISPSKKYIKISYSWYNIDQITIIEELPLEKNEK